MYDLLNKVQVGNIDDDVENLLEARFIRESDEKRRLLHVCRE